MYIYFFNSCKKTTNWLFYSEEPSNFYIVLKFKKKNQNWLHMVSLPPLKRMLSLINKPYGRCYLITNQRPGRQKTTITQSFAFKMHFLFYFFFISNRKPDSSSLFEEGVLCVHCIKLFNCNYNARKSLVKAFSGFNKKESEGS